MFARGLIEFIKGKSVDYAREKVERWYREEIDGTPKAFKFLDKDVDTLVDLVYEYHAQMMIARELLSAPLGSNADYLSVCTRVPKRREMEDLDDLIEEVQKLGDVSSDLKTQVRARVQRNIETAQKELNRVRAVLAREEAEGQNFGLMKFTGRAVSTVSRSLARHRSIKRQIERTGRDIDEQLAEILALLNNVKAELRNQQGGFAVLLRDCHTWASNWNQWDYNRNSTRGSR